MTDSEPRSTPCHRHILAMIALFAGLNFITPCSLAHTMLDRAQPPVGAVLSASPPAILLHFDSRIESSVSSIHLFAADGSPVPLPAQHQKEAQGVLSVALPALLPGTYRVVWQAFGLDGHRTHGDYRFTIQPPVEIRPHER